MNSFKQAGNTVTFTADTTPPEPVQPVRTDTPLEVTGQFRIKNDSEVTVFLGFGADAASALAAAEIPTSEAEAGGCPLGAGMTEVFSAPVGSFWTGKTEAETAVIYVTPGHGL